MLVSKFRLYPKKSQITIINKIIECHRLLYNKCLEDKKQNRTTCYNQMKIFIPEIKDTEFGKLCNYSSMQQTVRRLEKAFNNLFKRNFSFPRFKSKNKFKSIEFSKFGDGWKIKENKLYIQHVGMIKIRIHRAINNPKMLTLVREGNEYYALIIDDYQKKWNNFINSDEIGIDLGFQNFIVTSNGQRIYHPKPLKIYLKTIAKLQSKKKWLARQKVCKKVANIRKDFIHKITTNLVKSNSVIVVEDLQCKNFLTEIKNINRALSDVSFGFFLKTLSEKAESAGRILVKIDPSYTSQECSNCGKIKKKSLKERTHSCECGLICDRDLNAAKVIYRRGITHLGLIT